MKQYHRLLLPVLSLCFLSSTRGEIGNDNPTGVSGEYNGSITTAGSYDPYTGNAKRFVDDLTVTGSVGAYPLKWTRVLNTRGLGNWTHSYQWTLWVRPYEYYHHYPDQYEGPGGEVAYPDGRTLIFDIPQEPYTYSNSMAVETQDQLEHMGGGNFDLVMRDGGRVRFRHPAGSASGSDLKATEIVDPYGQITTLTYDGSGRSSRITEPGGRYLQINYTGPYHIDNVQAFDGRGNLVETVSYIYSPRTYGGVTRDYLTQVNYDDGTHAYYTYQNSNTGSPLALVQTCDDVRFAGPMKKIQYEYQADGGPYDVSWGQIKAERNATTGQVVSQLSPVPYEPTGWTAAHFQRTETRGDGATRLFQYSPDGNGQLTGYTDFKGQTTQFAFPLTAPWGQYRKSVTDARGNTTSVDRDWISDVIRTIVHPDGSTQQFTYTNTFYLASKTDQRNNTTYYDRDGSNRIWQTRHPDGSTEQFSYNQFGQIETHTMTSGGVENIRYDGRGLKYISWPPATPSDPDPWNHPTRYYYYQSGLNTDRLWYVVDPRGNATWYEYNGRGEVTKVTHQDGSYTQSYYNDDGTLAWTADENHPGAANDPNQRTRYTYDEYKRVLTVTNPLNQTTSNNYAQDWANPLIHTTTCVKATVLPSGKQIHYAYDENWRRIVRRDGPGTGDDAWTWFGYDAVGNLSWTQDPRNYVTHFGYDNRNRQTSITDALGNVTSTTYDAANNKTTVTRPGNQPVQFVEYDPMNRLKHQIDERGVHTYLHYDDAARNLTSQEDGNGKTYSYTYDQMNRKTVMTYPDASHEDFSYDTVGNLATHRNRAGAVQAFAPPDNRNRPTSFTWTWEVTRKSRRLPDQRQNRKQMHL